jgi:quinol monooxygenase YgiN
MEMFVVCVTIHVLAEHVEAFVEATLANARGTRQEPGNERFDVLRANEEAARFFLYEVYQSEEAFRSHQQTPHYLAWKGRVAPMMAAPRVGVKHQAVFPEPWA